MTTKNEFQFRRVVFFGRGIDEYVKMFGLDLAALRGKRILDCCAGPAAFAKQAEELGIEVVACDPLYDQSLEELRKTVDGDAASVTEKQAANPQLFHKELVPTAQRRTEMEVFLGDFASGKGKRYVEGALPHLPFDDRSFDLVLVGNLLFIYSDVESGGMLPESPFDYKFHSEALAELERLSRGEVRIYPLQGPSTHEHKYLRNLIEESKSRHHKAEIVPVPQRDIIGAENMLRIDCR